MKFDLVVVNYISFLGKIVWWDIRGRKVLRWQSNVQPIGTRTDAWYILFRQLINILLHKIIEGRLKFDEVIVNYISFKEKNLTLKFYRRKSAYLQSKCSAYCYPRMNVCKFLLPQLNTIPLSEIINKKLKFGERKVNCISFKEKPTCWAFRGGKVLRCQSNVQPIGTHAWYILLHQLTTITPRKIQRGSFFR